MKNNRRGWDGVVFIDRDGTIIVDIGYIDDPDRIEFLPGAIEAIHKLNLAGIKVIMVSNQSGVARGFFSMETAREVDSKVILRLRDRNAIIHASYFCPHHPDASVKEFRKDCWNRKPNPGMVEIAANEHCINLRKSYVIGDKISDLELARNIGAEPILVRTGEGVISEAKLRENEAIAVFDTISSSVSYIIGKVKGKEDV
ncbi:HAD family hydrolase [bacterium]|nr:HAD family hydrolase [bacterium]